MKLTEQGEVISAKYTLRELAQHNIEVLLSSVLDATVLHRSSRLPPETLARFDDTMELVATAAREAYDGLVGRDGLAEFFAQATPLTSWGH